MNVIVVAGIGRTEIFSDVLRCVGSANLVGEGHFFQKDTCAHMCAHIHTL